MTRRAQPRTGKMFKCSNLKCKRKFYAAPSRATIIERDGKGYCSPECKFVDKKRPLTECPICLEVKVKYPNTYCGLECAHKANKAKRTEKALAGVEV